MNKVSVAYEEAEFARALTKAEFCITNEAEADWYIAKVGALKAEEAMLRATGEAKIKRVVNEREGLEYRLQSSLEHWAEEQIKGTKHKSYILDHGVVAFRTDKGGLKITDKAAAFEFAKKTNEVGVLTFTASLDVEAYKRFAARSKESHGELLPGVEMVETRQIFSLRFPKKGDDPIGTEEEKEGE